MKNILKTITTLAAVALTVLHAGAQQTKILTADKHNEYGLVYTLPTTAFEVEVTATRTVMKAGPYRQYARKYVGTDKVVQDDAEVWTLNSVRVRPYGVPKDGERYLMQLKPGATTFMGVAADGMLLSINTNPADKDSALVPPATVRTGEALDDNEYLQYVDQDFISSQSSAKQAQMLAESLMEIRDAKVSLTRGTADQMPTDGKQLELMLNSLRHQEAAITAAFLGNVTSETVTRSYNLIPDGEGKFTVCRLSGSDGFVDANDYSGEPLYANIRVVSRAELPVDAKGEAKKLPKDGVAYCVPGSATLSLTFKGNNIFSGDFEMSQFGLVFALNPQLFSDRKQPSYAVFDPATGALKEIGELKESGED